MTLHEHPEMAQRSDEWYAARCGIITASVVSRLITPKTIRPSSNDDTRALTALLVAERVTGHVDPTYVNADMWRGIEDEPRALEKYAEHHGVEVTTCGFMVNDDTGHPIGYSPDGLVGNDGLIEVKCPRQKAHLQTILDDAVPSQYMAQLQTGLLVSGRRWIDYVSFCGGMPLWTKRVTPDPDWYLAIVAAVDQFEERAAEMVADYQAAVAGLPMTERLELVVI